MHQPDAPPPDSIEGLCDAIERLVPLGPGENPDAAAESRALLQQLSRQPQLSDSLHTRVDGLREGLGRWFSPARWRSDPSLSAGIYQDLAAIRGGPRRG